MVDTLKDEPGRLAAVSGLNAAAERAERPFDHIAELAKNALNFPLSAVTLITQHTQHYKACHGFDAIALPRERSFCAHVILQREVFVIEDVRADPHFAQCPLAINPPRVASYAGAPLILPDGYQVGALSVMDVRPRVLTTGQRTILTQLAGCVVREFELRREAAQDDLTGLMRRSSFFKAVQEIMRQALTQNLPVALVLLDLDRFKLINDTHGHAAGDGVLTKVAQICDAVLGDDAILGRVGGEEFALCLPGFDQDGAFRAMERLRLAIAGHPFDDVGGEPVTASAGLAMLDHAKPDLATWYKTADTGLYAAKEDGRNRIVIAGDGILLHEAPKSLPYLDLSDPEPPETLVQRTAA
ncbi:MAG: sensor domain-containing diguanylate cyclase [Pseudomonadota bacterium]